MKELSSRKRSKMLSNLKRTRLLQGKTQYDLMLETGIDQGLISLFENNYKKPNEIQKKNLAEALKTPKNELFPEDN
jgi:transcriptional regulator with XRE-family HTH domain